jgi:tRNA nucleotidyltransferase/poly(A) polymerase
MSDYMFMLENHLSAEQNRVVADVHAAATAAEVRVFLVGGAMRDVLGGFRVRDLDFAIEGNALRLAKTLADKRGAQITYADEARRSADLLFPGGVTAEIGMARQEKYARTGAKPQISPATIQEDLRRRDFSINAVALSLNQASLGLLLDPTNGLADLANRELRALYNYSFYDVPIRLLRLVRFRVRLGFQVEERTRLQFENALGADVQKFISPRALFDELRSIAAEQNPVDILRALESEKLLGLFSPALASGKLDYPAIARLEKALRVLPADNGTKGEPLGPFLHALTEKLSPKEESAFIKTLEMRKEEVELWHKLEARAKKLETALRSARIKKPSQVHQVLSQAKGDELVFLLSHSAHKPVQERIKNYIQKYVPMLQELPPSDLAAIPGKPGTPAYEKARETVIARWLDRRPKKPEPPPEEPPPEVPARNRAR